MNSSTCHAELQELSSVRSVFTVPAVISLSSAQTCMTFIRINSAFAGRPVESHAENSLSSGRCVSLCVRRALNRASAVQRSHPTCLVMSIEGGVGPSRAHVLQQQDTHMQQQRPDSTEAAGDKEQGSDQPLECFAWAVARDGRTGACCVWVCVCQTAKLFLCCM